MKGEVDVDAVIYSAESGSAWTLIYPDYSVVVPQGMSARVKLGLVLPSNQSGYENFINQWLGIEETRGILAKLKNYWIFGVTEKTGEK